MTKDMAAARLTLTLRCPRAACGHRLKHHAADDVNPRRRDCTGHLYDDKPGTCGCGIPQSEIRDWNLDRFADVLASTDDVDRTTLGWLAHSLGLWGHDSPQAAAKDLVAIRGQQARWKFLDTEEAQVLWRVFVAQEGHRRDDVGQRMLDLAQTFPSLAAAVGDGTCKIAKGWSARELERWACSVQSSASGKCAAAFVLNVYNRTHAYAVGRFDAHEALPLWDTEHRQAFLAWAKDPWWA